MSRFRKLSHAIRHCQYQFVWVPKYRYRILTGVSRPGSGKMYSRLCITTWSRDRRVECAGRSRSFAGDGSTEGFEFRIHGNSQGSNSDPGVQQVSTPQTPTVLGQSFLGAGLLC